MELLHSKQRVAGSSPVSRSRQRNRGVLATHLYQVSNRTNEVMKVSSVVAAVFLPLTLLAGIYRVNFVIMPEIHGGMCIS